MTTVEQFVARLNAASVTLDGLTDPILTAYGRVVAREVTANAPKRTRRSPGTQMRQTSPGVIELPAGSYLVGAVRGSSRSSPKSRTFLSDSLDGISAPLARATAKAAVSALTDGRFSIRSL